jgi:hypothetical protein
VAVETYVLTRTSIGKFSHSAFGSITKFPML